MTQRSYRKAMQFFHDQSCDLCNIYIECCILNNKHKGIYGKVVKTYVSFPAKRLIIWHWKSMYSLQTGTQDFKTLE